MFQGQLVAIYVAARKRAPLHRVDQVRAVEARGLEGDRYFVKDGTYSGKPGPDREVTLIEIEAIEALTRESNLMLEPGQARRNLVTRGVPLNHLVGREFTVGDVRLRGIRLCEPCGHLESLTVSGVQQGLCHRGGLRAQVVQGGILHAGDTVRPVAAEPAS
jgi:MOSC domain-containing protein YiiM